MPAIRLVGRVTAGMEVVDRLVYGDVIEKITIQGRIDYEKSSFCPGHFF